MSRDAPPRVHGGDDSRDARGATAVTEPCACARAARTRPRLTSLRALSAFGRDLRVLEKLELNNRVQIALLAHDAGEA